MFYLAVFLSSWVLFSFPEYPSGSTHFFTNSPYYSYPFPGPRFPLGSCLYLLSGVVEQEGTAYSLLCCGLLYWVTFATFEPLGAATVRWRVRSHHGTPGFLCVFGMSFFTESLPKVWSVMKCCHENAVVLCMLTVFCFAGEESCKDVNLAGLKLFHRIISRYTSSLKWSSNART